MLRLRLSATTTYVNTFACKSVPNAGQGTSLLIKQRICKIEVPYDILSDILWVIKGLIHQTGHSSEVLKLGASMLTALSPVNGERWGPVKAMLPTSEAQCPLAVPISFH